ncbi:hypothetical protein WT60_20675 [Burkholderia sp. MSMB617WGS]|uniref:Uncharacterized protein n=1 Tax=Burkholderia savannae TaxID=1637837 RepID=A0ABR5T3J6_9BURK|nr:hypothetical protein WS78_30870 [Burkholderia savannae]AOK49351.1 hypothetical protein WT60_20675 [Burkholderia sp. MSMB617WGS]KVG46975.1 hypothetical protein WS77_29525 [Burkholderia sp. MSMB0265]KVG85256.1 hypothetical protein WS81_04720 [Burkholderia sp. MSMB2040]KVG91049.1 hypothetical protein WS82_15665 [Burkholderia sp. MSMB2041]KVG95163.1 hypothetical protein WS83_05850 [Burkholderia sp. MSMB2042]KVK71764.1 hypothetical protein WS91_23075 [Burkholderia sp. MSMB1498]
MQLLTRQTHDVLQPVHAVYRRNTAISSRIASFVDCLTSDEMKRIGSQRARRGSAGRLIGECVGPAATRACLLFYDRIQRETALFRSC